MQTRLAAACLVCAGSVGAGCSKSESVADTRALAGAGVENSSAAGGSSAVGGSNQPDGSSGFSTGGSSSIVGVGTRGGGANEADGGEAGVSTVNRDDACVTSTDLAQALPSVLELVVDTSGSMDWPPGWAPQSPDDSKPAGATKWEITRDALLAAVVSLSPESALGANFFPNISQSDDACLLNLVALPIALLAGSSSKARVTWASAVAAVVPEGATPTQGAYLFGLKQLAASQLPGNKFILLITDGTPTCTLDCQCTEDNLPVDSRPLIAETAEAFASGVRTFVIGSPGSEDTRDVLSQIATEGGTAKANCSESGPVYCHFDMTTEADLAGGLESALGEITLSLRSCEYPIPPPPAGQVLDPSRVNVLYTPGAGATQTIGRAPSDDACSEGWQYSADGTSIILCGEACAESKRDVASTVEVLFGCATVNAPPPR